MLPDVSGNEYYKLHIHFPLLFMSQKTVYLMSDLFDSRNMLLLVTLTMTCVIQFWLCSVFPPYFTLLKSY
jgi:hypothetical protein